MSQTKATQKYKRFVRYELDKAKKKYAFFVDLWRKQKRGSLFYQTCEESVRGMEKLLKIKTPAQYDEGKVTSAETLKLSSFPPKNEKKILATSLISKNPF